ncbi:MAG: GNAT family N-acetyltransferase, partial [Lachnospiraceae bacterium]|nr:GNAT family N-acetyltransferase [Lachnospiraceae bacterium]
MNTEIIRNYRNQNELRCSFNQLACKTFDGLDFEEWYQNGYWSERYDPHSIVIDGKVVANVSVNFMDFLWKGQRKRFIQLGTVMTQEGFRNQGLIRQIMNEIEKEYGQKVDGIYL